MTDAALPSVSPATSRAHRALPFATVEIHQTPADILAAWAELETIAPCSAYQTRDFLLTWIETLGAARGLKPVFITATDADNRIVALLPLGIERHGSLSRAVFLGGKESNFSLGLFRRPEAFLRSDIETLLRMAAKALGAHAPDVFLLFNQPHRWDGAKNPMSLLPHQPSPSYAYATALPRDAEAFFAAKQSKERRKKLRKKEARLAAMGELNHLTNDSPERTQAILSAFYAQKTVRFETQAIDADFSDPGLRSFYEKLSTPAPDGRPAMELHALACGQQIVAVFGGLRHRDGFNGMVISFDTDAEIAKSSPGELLLTRAIAAQCQRGVTQFDLGIGEADYKATYCEDPVALFDVVFPITIKGKLYAAYESARLRLKRSIKQNPALFVALRRTKRLLRRAARA